MFGDGETLLVDSNEHASRNLQNRCALLTSQVTFPSKGGKEVTEPGHKLLLEVEDSEIVTGNLRKLM